MHRALFRYLPTSSLMMSATAPAMSRTLTSPAHRYARNVHAAPLAARRNGTG